MPTVNPGSKILVTGASGFIAAWVIKNLLERGFHVRGTVRSPPRGEYLDELFGEYAGRFEYVIVEDIQEEGAFDEAVKDMDAIEHIASPYHFNADDPNELIGPALKGTLGILESAMKFGPAVRRVVITSSLAAIIEPADHQQILTETNWNNISLREVETKGREASGIHKYRASKTLAERAAWDFVEKHKDEIKFDVTALNPPLVWGPTIHEVCTATSFNTSIQDLYDIIKGKKDITATPVGNWVDVRDLAQAHIEVLTTPDAGGERFLLGSGPFTWQDFLDAVHTEPSHATLPKGNPGSGKDIIHPVLLDTTKASKVLGLNFRGINETAVDSVRSLLERERAQAW